jgi:hypothetical protein
MARLPSRGNPAPPQFKPLALGIQSRAPGTLHTPGYCVNLRLSVTVPLTRWPQKKAPRIDAQDVL